MRVLRVKDRDSEIAHSQTRAANAVVAHRAGKQGLTLDHEEGRSSGRANLPHLVPDSPAHDRQVQVVDSLSLDDGRGSDDVIAAGERADVNPRAQLLQQ